MTKEAERLDDFLLNSGPDEHDLRDYFYQPALVRVCREIRPPEERLVLHQG